MGEIKGARRPRIESARAAPPDDGCRPRLGLQFAFLSPALALVLVSVFGASDAQVGLVLAIANAAGLAASIVMTLLLAGALALAPSLSWATVALVVLGAPAGVGNALLFAHVRHSGATTAETMNVRAAGPPIAAFVMAAAGPRSVFALLAWAALYTMVLAVLLARRGRVPVGRGPRPARTSRRPRCTGRSLSPCSPCCRPRTPLASLS